MKTRHLTALFDLSLPLLIALTNIYFNLLSFIIINRDNAHLPVYTVLPRYAAMSITPAATTIVLLEVMLPLHPHLMLILYYHQMPSKSQSSIKQPISSSPSSVMMAQPVV